MHFTAIALLALQLQAAQKDTTLRVPAGTRLDAAVNAGSITVQGWNRPDVQISSKANPRTRINIMLDGAVLRVTSSVPNGIDVADLTINVPRAMDLTLGRGDVDITVKGSEGELNILNYRGLIDISGGRRIVSVKSAMGEVRIKDAKGRVDASSGNESIFLTDVAGDVDVKSPNKHITLERVDSHNLQALSVGGVIRFTGPLHEDGHYSFITHSGSIFVSVSGAIDATVSVATVSGAFSSPASYRITDKRRAGIFTAVFGNGRAQVTMESFVGGLVLKPM